MFFAVFAHQSIVKFSLFIFFLGLCPDDSYDEAVADMISDGVSDLINVLIKIHYEKDETKKVYLIALFEGVKSIFLCILSLKMFIFGADLDGFSGFGQ